MKKIIAAFDGLKFSESTKEYAIQLALTNNSHLVGIFLDDVSYTSYKIYELVGGEGLSLKKQTMLDKKDVRTRKLAKEIFEAACQKAGVEYSMHADREIAIKELIHETIYGDVLIIDSNETLTHYEESAPTSFIKNALSKTHCPVLVVPGNYKPVQKIIFLYDGTPFSVHAIKMFSYVFSSLKHLPVEVLSVKSQNQSLHLSDNELMKEYMKRHYSNIVYTILRGEASSKVLLHIRAQHQNPLVVLGAYSRSKLSKLIDESMADIIMKNTPIPLFLAHG